MLAKLVTCLLSPLGSSLCLLVLALFLAWRRRSRLSMACGALAMVWLWAWSIPVLSLWLRGTLEDQIAQPPLSRVPQTQAMVVLGGGVSPPSGKATDINLGAAADRVWYAARLFHAGKAPLLLLSGGSDPQRHAFSEARAMAIFLQDLGVPEQALVLEEASRNTLENAAFSAKLLNERGIRHVLLVTSALHMPRALALFAAQGLQVEPAPTDFEADNPPPGALAWLPDTEALDGSGRAMKEWVGKWVGR